MTSSPRHLIFNLIQMQNRGAHRLGRWGAGVQQGLGPAAGDAVGRPAARLPFSSSSRAGRKAGPVPTRFSCCIKQNAPEQEARRRASPASCPPHTLSLPALKSARGCLLDHPFLSPGPLPHSGSNSQVSPALRATEVAVGGLDNFTTAEAL